MCILTPKVDVILGRKQFSYLLVFKLGQWLKCLVNIGHGALPGVLQFPPVSGLSWLAYPTLYLKTSDLGGWVALHYIIQPFWLPALLGLLAAAPGPLSSHSPCGTAQGHIHYGCLCLSSVLTCIYKKPSPSFLGVVMSSTPPFFHSIFSLINVTFSQDSGQFSVLVFISPPCYSLNMDFIFLLSFHLNYSMALFCNLFHILSGRCPRKGVPNLRLPSTWAISQFSVTDAVTCSNPKS